MHGRGRYNSTTSHRPTSDLDRCTVNPPTHETPSPVATSDPSLPAPADRRMPAAPWWLTVLLALLAVAALWLAWQSAQRMHTLEQELVRRQQREQHGQPPRRGRHATVGGCRQ